MGLGTFGACACYCMLYGLVPDTVEYGEMISGGIRMDGFINMVAIALTYKIDYKRFDSIVSSLQHHAG